MHRGRPATLPSPRGFVPTASGTRDAHRQPMLRMKDTNKLIKNVLRALPAIPLIRRRRRASITPYILGALGIAIVGGITAVMLLSPRTRNRTLGMAKDSYGKVRGPARAPRDRRAPRPVARRASDDVRRVLERSRRRERRREPIALDVLTSTARRRHLRLYSAANAAVRARPSTLRIPDSPHARLRAPARSVRARRGLRRSTGCVTSITRR